MPAHFADTSCSQIRLAMTRTIPGKRVRFTQHDDEADGVNNEDYTMDENEDAAEDEDENEEHYSTQLGSQRMLAASIRRDGKFRDRETYEELLRNGAQLEDNLDRNTRLLNRPHDHAMFKVLKRQRAFELARICPQYEDTESLQSLYEILQEHGYAWDETSGSWVW